MFRVTWIEERRFRKELFKSGISAHRFKDDLTRNGFAPVIHVLPEHEKFRTEEERLLADFTEKNFRRGKDLA